MDFILQPWQLLLMILAGWVNQQQQEEIEYLRAENQVLKEKLGKKRILLNDDQRRRLTVVGKVLGRKRLEEIGTLFTPDTILRWHRLLVAKKWDYSARRTKTGRPSTEQEIVDLVLSRARENPSWGYDRIQGALQNLGHQVSDQTVGNILRAHVVEAAPERKRKSTWKSFLQSHWDVLAAIDFTTVEVWTKHGSTCGSCPTRTCRCTRSPRSNKRPPMYSQRRRSMSQLLSPEVVCTYGRAAETARVLPTFFPDDPLDYKRAADFLDRCGRAAAEDSNLEAAERERRSARYAEEAASLRDQARQRGYRPRT